MLQCLSFNLEILLFKLKFKMILAIPTDNTIKPFIFHKKFYLWHSTINVLKLNPNGDRWNPPIRQEIGCHFLQEPSRDLKILDSFKNDVRPRVKESFWAYLEWLSRKRTEFDKNLHIFWGENHKLHFFQKFW